MTISEMYPETDLW